MAGEDLQLHATPYIVYQAELATGILLTKQGVFALNGVAHGIPASTLEDAQRIASKIVEENSKIECWIKDRQGSHIAYVRGSSG